MAKQTIAEALVDTLRADAARPLITQVWADGRRAELSARTFENNVAKAANLLQDDLDAGGGTSLLIDLPLHWQTSVWLTAAALTGSNACFEPSQNLPVGLTFEAAFVDRGHFRGTQVWPTYVVSLHPLGLPEGELPEGGIDCAREVRAHSDVFVPFSNAEPDASWLRLGGLELTQIQAIEAAIDLARSIGLETGGRLFVSGSVTRNTVLGLSALPLALGASIVICADPEADEEATMRSEHCTAVLAL